MTNRLILSLLLVLTFCSCAWSQQAAAPATASKILELTVPAPSLKGNLLGDPTEQKIYVYLPPSYASSTKRYPTLYLLHGFLGNSSGWISGAYQGLSLQTLMDDLIKANKVREMIVVSANGFNAYGGSFYTNSPVTGNWDDFITKDLVSNIDSSYRTIAKAESRGIAGHSMGGYGAVTLGMKHPDVFNALYALSPCCLVMEADMSEANPAWAKVLSLTSQEQIKTNPRSLDDFFNKVFYALAAAFSPNPSRAPFFVDLPVQAKKEGCPAGSIAPCVEKIEDTYNKWRSHIPLYVIDGNKDNLMKLRGIFLDYGEKEQFTHIRTGAQQFSQALAQRGIPHQFEVYPEGDHGSRIRVRMETRVIQFFNEKLVFEK
jgi:S-formylglutathione hydrolase